MTLVDDAEALRLEGRWEEALALLEDELARDLGPEERGHALVELARTLNDRSTFGGAPDEARSEAVLRELEDLARAEADDALLAAALDLCGRALHARFLADRDAGEPEGELEQFERGLELRRGKDLRGVAESSSTSASCTRSCEETERGRSRSSRRRTGSRARPATTC